ncbi:MAG: hypothetical protein JST83_19455 [Bacteroidetes bacterium]|nr:hypothetical protein [Bacteroidota bacterium]
MKTKMSFTILFALSLISSCCTKKACSGSFFKQISIVFKGYSAAELNTIRITAYMKGTDSIVWPTPTLPYYTLQDSSINFGREYVAGKDSFYLDQRYFIISAPGRSDTIHNISYQYSHHTVNCNQCPGDNQPVTDVVNFSYQYNDLTHHEGDTVFIVK